MDRFRALIVSGLLCTWATSASLAAFTPLFEVSNVSGTVVAQPGDGGETRTLTGGEGLAYGTTLRTGPDSGLVINLSPVDRVTVGPNAVLTVVQDPDNDTMKILQIHKGLLDLMLSADFKNENGLQIATRCVVINMLAGGGATVESSSEADLKVVTIVLKSAQLELIGNDFRIPLLKDQDSITVACADDGSFVRLRDVNGKYTVQLKDSLGEPRLVEMVKDSVIRILRKRSDTDPNVVLVTVLEVGPDGNVVQADSYEQPAGEEPPLLDETPPPTEEAGDPEGSEPVLPTDETLPTSTSTSSTSTTTTTVPPGDLVPPPPPPPPPATTKPDATPRGRR